MDHRANKPVENTAQFSPVYLVYSKVSGITEPLKVRVMYENLAQVVVFASKLFQILMGHFHERMRPRNLRWSKY